jgi:hypothetical protein
MELSPGKKITETLHHALRAMVQFPVIFAGDTQSPNKIKTTDSTDRLWRGLDKCLAKVIKIVTDQMCNYYYKF